MQAARALFSKTAALAAETTRRAGTDYKPQFMPAGLEPSGRGIGQPRPIFFDAQQLIVFSHAIGARSGAGLDLSRPHSDHEIGDEGVFGFAGAMRNDGAYPARRAISMASMVSVTVPI